MSNIGKMRLLNKEDNSPTSTKNDINEILMEATSGIKTGEEAEKPLINPNPSNVSAEGLFKSLTGQNSVAEGFVADDDFIDPGIVSKQPVQAPEAGPQEQKPSADLFKDISDDLDGKNKAEVQAIEESVKKESTGFFEEVTTGGETEKPGIFEEITLEQTGVKLSDVDSALGLGNDFFDDPAPTAPPVNPIDQIVANPPIDVPVNDPLPPPVPLSPPEELIGSEAIAPAEEVKDVSPPAENVAPKVEDKPAPPKQEAPKTKPGRRPAYTPAKKNVGSDVMEEAQNLLLKSLALGLIETAKAEELSTNGIDYSEVAFLWNKIRDMINENM